MVNGRLSFIYSSWKSSLFFTGPFPFKAFLLVVLNKLFYLFKPFAGAGIVILAAIGMVLSVNAWLGYILFTFFLLCAARSSIDLKNGAYFIYKSLLYGVLYLVLCIIAGSFSHAIGNAFGWFPLTAKGTILNTHIVYFTLIAALFLLDSPLKIAPFMKVPSHTFRFLIYNYPALFLIGVVQFLVGFLVSHLLLYLIVLVKERSSLLELLVGEIAHVITLPLVIALISTLYIKRVYEQIKYYTLL